MKKLISGFMAVVLALGLMTVPAFAANGNPSSEKWVYDGYITGCGAMESVYNDKVLPMSEAPVMDYTKTIGPVTFSNFVSYDERDSKDANRNPIHMYRVTIGIDGCMRVNEDNCDIMYFPETTFNDMNLVAQDWYKFNNKTMTVDSDYNSVKTLTPMVKSWVAGDVVYRTERYNIQAYAGKQNYGGTWPEGLTWQFGAQYDCYRSSGDYFATYPISVKVGEETYYYFVTVKDKQTYTGDRADGKDTITEGENKLEVTPVVPTKAVAKPSSHKIYVNGVVVAFDVYNINSNNYFKLRDVAQTLRGTEKQFEVIWNPNISFESGGKEIRGAIDMTSNKPYTTVGGEMKLGDGITKDATLTTSPVLKDGKLVTNLTAYNIKGNNYFKLRDLGELFDFNVSWDKTLGAVVINTSESYDPST